ncbi:PASTA domain-containing protein [Bifidobacterium tibiigranuli]|jgi:beta-lactam-binding protein with PASTA domain|nr:PASTA domain-containing protein [Bifidobacterium tibiigranuli]MCH3975865.1 PASTA domain-containing protein [Bifidobacterium tibiigranuli]MCH4274701.1 PASTA domain-containing protein [Bifidobacterium tibiigranuli]
MPGAKNPVAVAAAKSRRLPWIAVIIVAAVVISVGIAAFATYRAEVWGGKTLPDPASIASGVNGNQSHATKHADVRASDVADTLRIKGLHVHLTPEFSGKGRGAFLGYAGVQPGARVRPNSIVTIRESAGPGVPKETVGRPATKVVDALESMGVPVHYKRFVVAKNDAVSEGEVLATYPSPGQMLPDSGRKDGIYVGVAAKGNGLSVKLIGSDIDKAQADLEAQGHNVTVKQRFSSKQYVGKVESSSPAVGMPLDDGEAVTLYEGVDASKVGSLLVDASQPGLSAIFDVSDAVSGTYCKNAINDPSKDCMTLSSQDDGYGQTVAYQEWGESAGDTPDRKDAISQCFASNGGDAGRCSISIDSGNGQTMKGGAGDRLIAKSWGLFDFGKGGEGPVCGGETISTWFASCVSGVPGPPDGSKHWDGSATYDMHDFFVYAAAGANLNAAKDSGYFDAQALQQAKNGKQADSSRPFILYRDPKLYGDTAHAKVTDANAKDNPFVPSTGNNGDKNDVKFKPAPSDADAYYLVEQGAEPDWASLDDADVQSVGAKTTDSTGKNSGSAGDASGANASAKTVTDKDLPQISSALRKGDFSLIAGKYCMKSGPGCITIDTAGRATSSGVQNYPLSPGNPAATSLHAAADNDVINWKVPADVGVELQGPDRDYQCGPYRGGNVCEGKLGEGYSEADLKRPADMVYVPAGVSVDKLEGLAGGSYADPDVAGKAKPDSSKAYLKLLAYHMNEPPTDDTVLYRVD